MKQLLIGLSAALMTLAATDAAHAGPLVAAAAAIGSFITGLGVIGQVIVSTALSVGLSLLQAAIAKKKLKNQRDPGVQLEVEMADSSPIGFTMGPTATAGTRRYIGSWGDDGGTPNAYLSDAIQYGDIPNPGQPGLWVDGKKVTILWGEAPTDKGYPVQEFRKDGKDHLWVRNHDGMQTAADELLVAKFGAHPTRPWTVDHIGRGCPYIVITALVNRELFTGQMNYLIEPPVTRWYDLRKDSTAGGSGSHRWNDPSTWEATQNPALLIYNLIRGVYYGSEWIFGGRNLAAFRLPAANWMAAANACDAQIDLAGGGTEAAYRAGTEIRGDMEPLAVIEELRKACAGRLAEVGGVFKLLVGAPGSAVYSFTDADVLITKGQSITPFPSIENTYNGVEATYPEPLEMWKSKDAPPRYDEDLEEQDGDRRLAVSISFPAVPYGTQVQRLMHHYWLDNRRFIQHSFYLPPDAYGLEPNDVVEWTSAANGYSLAKFIVVRKDGERTTNQAVHLREIDIGDADWSDELELPVSVGPIGQEAVPPQPMTGWQAFPAFLEGDDGEKQKPSIRVQFAANLDEVSDVHVQVRRKASGVIVFDGPTPYAGVPGNPKSIILNGVFEPKTVYEVRGKFLPYSSRRTLWSNQTMDGEDIVEGPWLEVTTPAITAEAVYDVVKQRATTLLAEVDATIRRLAKVVGEQDASNYTERQELARDISVQVGNARAFFNEKVTTLAGVDAAQALLIQNLGAELDLAESNLSALISNEQIARVAADGVLASNINILSARVDDTESDIANAEAAISDEQIARVAADGALASDVGGLTTRIGNAESDITTQQTSITTLEQTLNDFLTDLVSTGPGGEAQTTARFTTLSSIAGFFARILLQVRAGEGEAFAEGGLELAVADTPEGPKSVAVLGADDVFARIGSVLFPFKGLQRNDEAKIITLDSGDLVIDFGQKHRVFYCQLTANAVIKFPLNGWLGAKADLIIYNPDNYDLDVDFTSIIVNSGGLPQPTAGAGSYALYELTIMEMSPARAGITLEVDGSTTSADEAQFSIDPPDPVTGRSVWNLAVHGPLVLEGPVSGAGDFEYTIVPLGVRLDCVVELQAPGGTSGSVFQSNENVVHPDAPNASTFTSPDHSGFAALTANPGAPSNSVYYSNGSHTGHGDGGDGSGTGATVTNGSDGGDHSGNIGGNPWTLKAGKGGDSPAATGPTAPTVLASPTSNRAKSGVQGVDPGTGAAGAAIAGIGVSSFFNSTTGGAGGGGKVAKTYNTFTPLNQGKHYVIKLTAPKPPKTSDIPANWHSAGAPSPIGAAGGRARVTISALP